MTKYDIGELKGGTRVIVDGKTGTVVSPHEPEWRDHRTKMWMHVLQGADITFEDEKGCAYYIHCDKIDLI